MLARPLALGLAFLTFGAAVAGAAETYRPRADLLARHPEVAALRKEARPRLEALEQTLSAAEAAGRDVSCARQALTELQWRIGYTSDVSAARAVLARTEALAADPRPPSVLVQDADGSYGACIEPWFNKLDASTEQLLLAGGWPGALPPRFLDRINDPARLKAYLDDILVSDIAADGIDRRKELNAATSALVRVIMRDMPRAYRFDPGLKAVVLDFIKRWQDPATGFFGAWYRVDGGIIKTVDLSLTFHMASYLDGAIDYWPALIDTLLRIKAATYPNGWLDDDGMTNHNNYDVAMLMKLGWPRMREDQRVAAAAEIRRMLDWCLGTSLLPDGSVVQTGNGESLPDTYYFTVGFLDTVGYFDPAKRFWTDAPLPDGSALRRSLRNRIERFDPSNPLVPAALRRLG